MINEAIDRLRDSNPVSAEVTPEPFASVMARIEAEAAPPTRTARPVLGRRLVTGLVPALGVMVAIAVVVVAVLALGHRGRTAASPGSRPPAKPRLLVPKRGMPGVIAVDGAALRPGGVQTIALEQCFPCAAGSPAGQHTHGLNLTITGHGFTSQGPPAGAVGATVFMGRNEWIEGSRSLTGRTRTGAAIVSNVVVSHDAGVTWQLVAGPAGWQLGGVAASADSVWAVATRTGRDSLVLHGSQTGDHLMPVRTQPIATTDAPIVVPGPGDTAYLDVAHGINDVRHLVTHDGGQTWQTLPKFCPIEGGDRTLTVDPAGSLWRFCWNGHGPVLLGRSTDGGHTYRSYHVPAPGSRGAPERFQAVSEQVAWEMTDHGDIIRITKGGERAAVVWRQSDSQATTVNGIPEALSVVNADSASVTVVVGPDHHAHSTGSYIVIYTTRDGGRTWAPRQIVPRTP